MQLIIDLPDRLARRLATQRERLDEIIERGLQRHLRPLARGDSDVLQAGFQRLFY